jgi:hypothetical protein
MSKLIISENKIEKIFIDYIVKAMKINKVPVCKDNQYIFSGINNKPICIIGTKFETLVECRLEYRFYVKWYEILNLEPLQYHNLLKSAFSEITGYKISDIIPYLTYN